MRTSRAPLWQNMVTTVSRQTKAGVMEAAVLSPSLAPCKKQSNTSTPEQRPQLNRPVMSSGMNQALNDMECPPF